MRNITKLATGLVMICLFYTCGKKRHVHITGKVYNPVTQEGIEGAELWLLKPGPITEYNAGNEGVATVFSDENGHFEVDVKSANADVLRLGNMHGNYYKIGWYQNGEKLPSDLPVKKGETQYADFYAVPYGYIQLKINNVNCLNTNDHFVLYAEGTQADDSKNGKMIDEYGCYHYDPEGYTKVPMGKRYYMYKVIRNNTTEIYRDTIFIDKGEHRIYEINY